MSQYCNRRSRHNPQVPSYMSRSKGWGCVSSISPPSKAVINVSPKETVTGAIHILSAVRISILSQSSGLSPLYSVLKPLLGRIFWIIRIQSILGLYISLSSICDLYILALCCWIRSLSVKQKKSHTFPICPRPQKLLIAGTLWAKASIIATSASAQQSKYIETSSNFQLG
jgi:hypothetical protein